MTEPTSRIDPEQQERCHYIPWLMLISFLVTFLTARAVVMLVMLHHLSPSLFVQVKGTHVHHLNYGIFILAGVGLYLLVQNPTLRARRIAAIVFGVGLGLTFDEFGMWLHLGGGYWQRSSFDAIVIVTAILGLIATMPHFNRLRPRRLWTPAAIVLLLVCTVGLWKTAHRTYARLGPWLQEMVNQSP